MTRTTSPALIWHVYPLGALGADLSGADRRPRGTLRDLIEWLPHVAALGADTVLLGPVLLSVSHGYDTIDHRVIDDRLGDADDFDAFVQAARKASIGVVLDGAFAYSSARFWRLNDPVEADDPWFLRTEKGSPVPWRVDSLLTPDYASHGYRSYVAEVMISWLDRGIMGWRLDSAWSPPAAFWRPVLSRVRAAHPDAWLLGQVFDDDLPPAVNSVPYSSATEYTLMHGIREWLAGASVERMVAALRSHQHNTGVGPVHTFVGNHDFGRLVDVVGVENAPVAFAVLLTLPGVPGIYYGDELGLTSNWAVSGDDTDLRPVLRPTDEITRVPVSRRILTQVSGLGRFRRDNPWLTRAALVDITVTDSGGLRYTVADADHHLQMQVNPNEHRWIITPAPGPTTSGSSGYYVGS